MFNDYFLLLASAQLQSTSGRGGGWLLYLLIILFVIGAAYWKVFQKAGQPGFLAFVPLLNVMLMLGIAGKPMWWILLLFIPGVNFLVVLMVYDSFAKAYGRGSLFALGLLLLPIIFVPILALSDAQYVGTA
jgi:hypothetical protein